MRLPSPTYFVIPLAALGVLATGCIDAEDPGPEPMCAETTDCDHLRGEICDDGICWGDPPTSIGFAALLDPPDERGDLVKTEISNLDISPDGTIVGLVFAETVEISGRVLLACADGSNPLECDPSRSIAAQIQITRPSRIVGGPIYTRGVLAEADKQSGEIAFSIRLPKAVEGEEPYEITVQPDDGNLGNVTATGLTPSELAPPIRFEFPGTADDVDAEWILGDPLEHKIITGRVIDAAGRGLDQMQVWALGRWNPLSAKERASTITTTDAEGYYTIRIPIEMENIYDLVVKPEPGVRRPTLTDETIWIGDPADPLEPIAVQDLRMPSYADPITFVVPLFGTGSGGTQEPVAGADVWMKTVLESADGTVAEFVAQGSTDGAGEVELELIPGGMKNRTYVTRVVPPTSSEHASVDGLLVSVSGGAASDRSFLASVQLERRVAVSGTIVGNDGVPIANASVAARASLRFKAALPLLDQLELAALQFPTVTTDDNGDFKVWLDPWLVNLPSRFDFDIDPPAESGAPRWSILDVQVGPDFDTETPDDSVSLGELVLPQASFARGAIATPNGDLVPGAQLRLLQLNEDQSFCANAVLPPGIDLCEPPAHPRGLWQSQEDGVIQIVLPDPVAAP